MTNVDAPNELGSSGNRENTVRRIDTEWCASNRRPRAATVFPNISWVRSRVLVVKRKAARRAARSSHLYSTMFIIERSHLSVKGKLCTNPLGDTAMTQL
jgi:hypothetical protein